MSDYVPTAKAVFSLNVSCELPTQLGKIQSGDAMMIPITGGTITGDRLNGEVLPGGADWAIRYEGGLSVVDARYAIKADDGTIIQVFNGGTNLINPEDPSTLRMLTTPRFIAPEGPHDWLNRSVFVGTLEPDLSGSFAVNIVIYQMV